MDGLAGAQEEVVFGLVDRALKQVAEKSLRGKSLILAVADEELIVFG